MPHPDLPREPPAAPTASTAESVPALRFVNVHKSYVLGDGLIRALDGLSFEVPRGEFVAVVGRSGSGKSTLLQLAAGLDVPTSGEVWVDGRELSRLGDDELTVRRRERVGMVHQFFNLLGTLSVTENVALPLLLAGGSRREALARAEALLAQVGLEHRLRSRPHMLSGGEMQRVAIARALVHEPALVLADEPTGNLDSRAAAQVVELLGRLAHLRGATVVLVTHSREAAGAATRTIELRDGRIVADERTVR
ncbi:MAG: ABC transporter ATP-binding protein [Candidatus Eisenbacteria bacterium]|nr:ABC transporter ATP-binding protein [Candidatus Eisenbacteria bacterium]